MNLKKMLFRSTRGKAYVHFFEPEVTEKDRDFLGQFDHLVFIVVFEEGHALMNKVKRICSSISDNLFEIHRQAVTS